MKGRPSPTETFRTTPPAPCACASTKAETTSWQICNKYNDQFPAVTIPEYKFKELIQKNRGNSNWSQESECYCELFSCASSFFKPLHPSHIQRTR